MRHLGSPACSWWELGASTQAGSQPRKVQSGPPVSKSASILPDAGQAPGTEMCPSLFRQRCPLSPTPLTAHGLQKLKWSVQVPGAQLGAPKKLLPDRGLGQTWEIGARRDEPSPQSTHGLEEGSNEGENFKLESLNLEFYVDPNLEDSSAEEEEPSETPGAAKWGELAPGLWAD